MVHNAEMIVDCALYSEGRRLDVPRTLDSLKLIPDYPGSFGWLGLSMPDADELGRAVEVLGCTGEIEVEEVLAPHTRPVLSLDGPALEIVLPTARYVDRDETISLGELTVLVWENAIISVREVRSPICARSSKPTLSGWTMGRSACWRRSFRR